MTDFDQKREGTGTAEWAEVTENICLGCPNDCLYCYAAHNMNRFKRRDRADWAREELTKRAVMKSYPAKDGVVMFPTSHDITPFNVKAYIRVAKLILEAGNKLLIVTKPRWVCIQELLGELAPWRDQILFRFTMGTLDAVWSRFWEPGAPLPCERLDCLIAASSRNRGFSTSVSCEPMLGGLVTTVRLVDAVSPYVTETIWVGKMNKARLRVDMSFGENRAAVERIEDLQDDEQIIKLFLALKSNPKVRWKDSIKLVLSKHGYSGIGG